MIWRLSTYSSRGKEFLSSRNVTGTAGPLIALPAVPSLKVGVVTAFTEIYHILPVVAKSTFLHLTYINS
jgi:hypothetical protein